MHQPASTSAVAPHTILVIEDDASYGELLAYQLRQEGYNPVLARTGEEGLSLLSELDPAVVLLDVMLPGCDGRVVLEQAKAQQADLPIVMMTAAGSVDMAVECMKRGSYDFLTKPFDLERLHTILRNAIQFRDLKSRVQSLEGQLCDRNGFENLLAFSPIMKRLVSQAQRASASDSDILILGESGVGKEVFARAIHYSSPRRKGPFVAINCGAIPEGLMESELFGHEKGAFTGATARRTGCFEQSDGGTLFLDEIGEMRPDMQVRLLRALEQREIRRVGGDRTIKVNVRVISATNQNVLQQVQNNNFRTDLYYRLAILVLELPPLRERIEDIGPLAQHFLREAELDGHTRARSISKEALEVLMRHNWPGNVRELRNAIERAVVFEDSEVLTINSLPPDLLRKTMENRQALPPVNETIRAVSEVQTAAVNAAILPCDTHSSPLLPASKVDFSGAHQVSANPRYPMPEATPESEILTMDEEEKKIIMRALSITDGNISEAARKLGVHRSTLHRKMTRYGLATDEELLQEVS